MSGLRNWWIARSKRPLVVALLSLLLAGLMAWVPAQAEDGAGAGDAPSRKGPAYKKTKTLTRVLVDPVEGDVEAEASTVTVTASETKNLRGRQRVEITWEGAPPSGGRASDPYGEKGMLQEYPVVVLQCRGADDPSLPLEKQLRPETCWTTSVAQRSMIAKDAHAALWTRDLHAAPEDRALISGLDPFPSAEECKEVPREFYYTHVTPFVAKNGQVFAACDAAHMPAEASLDAAFPPNEIAAFTDEDGTGSVQFEVRSEAENRSLGCNHKTDCAIVVIPIKGLSCAAPTEETKLADQACRLGGRFAPGSNNFVRDGVDQAVSPMLWWSESNWRNRFTIPITFGLPPSTCDIRDPRAPTAFYGSELLAQASIQWAPAYCLDKKRFKFQHNQMSDEAGWNLMESGTAAAALVSSEHESSGDPVGYAPTAATGFAIGYAIDRPDNAGELGRLRLNGRLLAKLITQSYLGSDLGRGHPGIGDNPLGIMNDPEFIKLNPGLSQTTREAGAALLSLSNSSDVVYQLTDYIAHDKDAMTWLKGKPDPWGMKVNPKYRKIKLPRSEWPLLDTFKPETNDPCRQANPAVYFNQLAAPVTTLRKIAEAVLDAWPNMQTRCDADLATNGWKLGRGDRQSYGGRFMLGLVSLGDADRFGLRTAALETKPKKYVEPTTASLAAAVALMKQDKKLQPFVLDQADVRKSSTAYPGTMVVYTAARLRNLPEEDAAKVALFMRTASTENQQEGFGNGELPGGFLPITRQGVTAKLHAAAQDAADAVEKQAGATGGKRPSKPGDASTGGTTSTPSAPSAPDAGAPAPADPVAAPATTAPEPVVTAATTPVSSRWGTSLMPSLLLVGLLALAISAFLRFVFQPRRMP